VSIFRVVVPIVAGVLLSMPQTADAQKNIKVGLALPKDKPGADFVNGMYERFGSEVQARTNGTLTVDIVYGGALGDPNDRMKQMQNGAVLMSDAAYGNYATVYPEIGIMSIPYLFATTQNAH
jgi:TRAP-type transport system periplasmic protein